MGDNRSKQITTIHRVNELGAKSWYTCYIYRFTTSRVLICLLYLLHINKKMGKNKLPKLQNKTNYRTPRHAANISFETISSIVRSISRDFAHDWNDELRQAYCNIYSSFVFIDADPFGA